MRIVTITLNPSLDKNTTVDYVVGDKKLRCSTPYYEPGGGGINVSRALNNLGMKSCAWFASSGNTGERIQSMLINEKVDFKAFDIQGSIRINLAVSESTTGRQYRFGMPGPSLEEHEWQAFLDEIEKLDERTEYIVASGSLPQNVPSDFYARMARICKIKNIKLIVDTSGEALTKVAEEGVYLIKPNLNELAQLAGKKMVNFTEQENLARQIVNEGKTEIMVLSLGSRGVMAVTKDKIEYTVPPTVHKVSVVGAGDSLVAGLMYGFAKDWKFKEIIMHGVAAGTAATLSPGTELCKKDDVELIFNWMKERNDC